MKKESKTNMNGLVAAETAKVIERTQIQKYHNQRGGGGFAAEDANALADKLSLKKVDVTGTTNELNGADRIVDGQLIQTKYWETPEKTINSSFAKKTGDFRYQGQQLEVPADQYDNCLELMKDKIKEGKVPGVTDPADAKKIVKRGSVTYKQARNIARAGNIDSLVYDSKTHAISSSYIFAISFAIAYARAKWDGKPNKVAINDALGSALAAGSVTFVTGVVTSQVLRTKTAAAGTVTMRHGVKAISKTAIGKSAVQKIASASVGKTVHGAAAVNHVSKLLRSNAITAAVTTAVITAPDIYRAALAKNISWAQFYKNLVVNAAGVGGGIGGWIGGAAAGTGIGGPIGGVVGGILGALAGGAGGSIATKKIADQFVEDDAVEMMCIVKLVAEEQAYDYLLTEKEIEVFAYQLKTEITASWLRDMYAAGNKSKSRAYATSAIEKICSSIIKNRKKIHVPKAAVVQKEIDVIAESVIEEINAEDLAE